jgi:hypothetical protein
MSLVGLEVREKFPGEVCRDPTAAAGSCREWSGVLLGTLGRRGERVANNSEDPTVVNLPSFRASLRLRALSRSHSSSFASTAAAATRDSSKSVGESHTIASRPFMSPSLRSKWPKDEVLDRGDHLLVLEPVLGVSTSSSSSGLQHLRTCRACAAWQ